MLPMTYKGFNRLLLMYIKLYGLIHMLMLKPLRCINTLRLGVYDRYTLWNMLYIPQQNPLNTSQRFFTLLPIHYIILNPFTTGYASYNSWVFNCFMNTVVITMWFCELLHELVHKVTHEAAYVTLHLFLHIAIFMNCLQQRFMNFVETFPKYCSY